MANELTRQRNHHACRFMHLASAIELHRTALVTSDRQPAKAASASGLVVHSSVH